MLNKPTLIIILASCALFPATHAQAATATVLQNCFAGPMPYTINYGYEIPSGENIVGRVIDDHQHFTGDQTVMEANCDCPVNMRSTSEVTELTAAGSPLAAGVSGYGYLTEHVDVDVSGYSEAINSPTGNDLLELKIDEYPTSPSNRANRNEVNHMTTEASASVCSDSFASRRRCQH